MMVEQHCCADACFELACVARSHEALAVSLNIVGMHGHAIVQAAALVCFAALFPTLQQGESSHRAQPPTLPL